MTKPAEIRIGKLSVAHLPEIVTVHVQSFPQSIITRLGPEAVRRYYEWQFIGPHQAHYLGAWVDGQVGGFCIGGKFRGAMGGFLSRNKWFLARQVLLRPWLLASAEVRSAVVTALRRLLQPPSPVPHPSPPSPEQRHFGILAIATAPPYRRLGLGARLMAEVEKLAREFRFAAMGLTVHPNNEPAICFYKRLGWSPVDTGGHWQGRMEKALDEE